jgi:hypothetical protein
MNKRTPPAQPQPCEVTELKSWRKNQAPENRTGEILTPVGFKQGDELHDLNILDNGYSHMGARRGDKMIVYATDDIQKGDYVAITSPDGLNDVGEFDSDECYLYLDNERYHRSKFQILGRVVEIQRRLTRRTPKVYLRPIRGAATIYQFKQRA